MLSVTCYHRLVTLLNVTDSSRNVTQKPILKLRSKIVHCNDVKLFEIFYAMMSFGRFCVQHCLLESIRKKSWKFFWLKYLLSGVVKPTTPGYDTSSAAVHSTCVYDNNPFTNFFPTVKFAPVRILSLRFIDQEQVQVWNVNQNLELFQVHL